jgi:asparagine synthase (glutamine-hydrolysing)
MNLEKGAERLACLLSDSVKKCIGDEKKAALLFSGGLDSTVLAVLARKRADLALYVVGTPDSPDMRNAAETAYVLDMPLVKREIGKIELLASLEKLVTEHDFKIPRCATTFIASHLALSSVKERIVLSGQGADELFGGYKKYAELSRDDAEKSMLADLSELLESEMPAYRALASKLGKEVRFPFLEPDVAEFAKSLPMECKLAGSADKIILRRAAGLLGVPDIAAGREKKAMQYGSGISKVLRAHLKAEGKTLSELMAEMENGTRIFTKR